MVIKQKEPENYDIWLRWYLSDRCTLECAYCTVGPIKKTAKIPNIEIPPLIRVLENTGKTFKISFTGGGEPFLVPNLVEACVEITKKHYISLTTNLTSVRIAEFAKRINPRRVFHILASAHIKELEKRNLLDIYCNNFLLLREKGFNIKAIEVAYPPLLNEVKRYRLLFKNKGIELEFNPFLGNYNGKKYPFSYTQAELEIFGLNSSKGNSPKKNYQYLKLCNAGYNVVSVNPRGDIYPCDSINNKIGNIYNKIEFKKNLIVCPFKFCGCPINEYDPYLFKKALKEVGTSPKKLNSIFLFFNFLKKQRQKNFRTILADIRNLYKIYVNSYKN